jgi:hypothetical protein
MLVLAHVLVGEPGATSPGHAPARLRAASNLSRRTGQRLREPSNPIQRPSPQDAAQCANRQVKWRVLTKAGFQQSVCCALLNIRAASQQRRFEMFCRGVLSARSSIAWRCNSDIARRRASCCSSSTSDGLLSRIQPAMFSRASKALARPRAGHSRPSLAHFPERLTPAFRKRMHLR